MVTIEISKYKYIQTVKTAIYHLFKSFVISRSPFLNAHTQTQVFHNYAVQYNNKKTV